MNRHLIEHAQRGDVEAFAAIVRGLQDMAVGYALSILGDVARAEDAAQEAFLEAYRGLGRLREPEALRSWLRKIVLKHCDREMRGRPRALPLDEAADVAVDARLADRLVAQQALSSLPENEREVVALFYLGPRSLTEVAEFLEVPLSTVKNRLLAARRLLKERMTMVDDVLRDGRPSRDASFLDRVIKTLCAAAEGDVALLDSLVTQDPEVAQASGKHPYWGGEPQPLQVAAEWGQTEAARRLLDAGADPNARSPEYDWTPLHLAIHRGHDDVARLLIDRGARIDICLAASLGHLGIVTRMLDENPRLANFNGPDGMGPIFFAATREVAELLLERGASLAPRSDGATVLRVLASHGPKRRSAARFLSLRTGEDDIWLTVSLGDYDGVERWLDRDPELVGARTERTDALGFYGGGAPLHIAARLGELDIARLLLVRGADPDQRSRIGNTPLHEAAACNQLAVADLLLRSGADVNAIDDQHQSTPLGWAEFQRKEEMVAFLRARTH